MRVIELMVKSLPGAAVFNPDVRVAPACVLWPDRDRQWDAALPRLREDMRELFTLGDYAPDKRLGQAIWLRCGIVLRDRPSINWDKDRGKDVLSAPWYHLFTGDRINDHHLSLAEKRKSREEVSKNQAQ